MEQQTTNDVCRFQSTEQDLHMRDAQDSGLSLRKRHLWTSTSTGFVVVIPLRGKIPLFARTHVEHKSRWSFVRCFCAT